MRKKSVELLKSSVFGSFLALVLSQILFWGMEETGWIPNMRDIDGKLINKIMNQPFVKEWFDSYETPYFNLVTLVLVFALLVQVIVACIQMIRVNRRGEKNTL
ncbi:MAG: YfzA family protein [Solibacillus sp.]|uniref:YfzA family protein n=1 Tax=unclassified Solibacillus TaxID=2637870 RepID=UPI0030F75D3D